MAPPPITPTERAVLDYLLEGMENEEIAERMRWTVQTVKNVFRYLYAKYGIFDGDKRVRLAVQVYYERNPHMIPFS